MCITNIHVHNSELEEKRHELEINCTIKTCLDPDKKIALKNYSSHFFECLGKKGPCPNKCGAIIQTLEEGNNHLVYCYNFIMFQKRTKEI